MEHGRPTWGRAGSDRRSLRGEMLLVIILLLLYNAGRLLAATRVSGAFSNAQDLLADERWLHLPREQTLQSAVLALPDLTRLANGYYALVHFPLTIGVLVWLWLRRPAHYLWARRSLVAATAAGLGIMVVLPTAPPRLMPGYGFVDTGLAFGQSVYGPIGHDKLANQFAALPSLHVGWALLVAIVCISASRTRWRFLWLAHAALTLLVVVVTGNHYWIDALVGMSLVTGALVVTRSARRTALPVRSAPAAVPVPVTVAVSVPAPRAPAVALQVPRQRSACSGSGRRCPG